MRINYCTYLKICNIIEPNIVICDNGWFLWIPLSCHQDVSSGRLNPFFGDRGRGGQTATYQRSGSLTRTQTTTDQTGTGTQFGILSRLHFQRLYYLEKKKKRSYFNIDFIQRLDFWTNCKSRSRFCRFSMPTKYSQ